MNAAVLPFAVVKGGKRAKARRRPEPPIVTKARRLADDCPEQAGFVENLIDELLRDLRSRPGADQPSA